MKAVVVGCGNVGIKRINALQEIPEIEIIALVEVNTQQQEYLQNNYSYPVSKDYKKYLEDDSVDSFIISAPTHPALKIIEDSLKSGKNVLCEKPLGDQVAQTKKITELSYKGNLVLQIGFNIRYDKGLQKAKSLIEEGKIGKPYFFKCTYVNGSVKTNDNKVGALLDMGIHNIYLAKMFMGNVRPIASMLQRHEYIVETRDDNGFAFLKSKTMLGSIHFSLVRWKNEFKLEITGSDGSVIVESLTKWGTQATTLHERTYPSGVPEEKKYQFSGDDTWKLECMEFIKRVNTTNLNKNNEALEAMLVAQTIRDNSIT